MFPDYQNQLAQMLTQQISQPMIKQEEHIVKVSGKQGAEAYQLANNSDKLLLDSTASVVWLIQTDGNGNKIVTGYDIAVREEEKPEDVYKSLEERISKLEEKLNEQSNTSSAKQRKSAE